MPRPSHSRRPAVTGPGRARLQVAVGLSLLVLVSGGADGDANPTLARVLRSVDRASANLASWYRATPPAERIPAGGLIACGALGAMTLLERTVRLRRRRVLPGDFIRRLKDRMDDVKLDRGKVLDLCELNPSPASRVALAAVKRWGRPTIDLERAATMAGRVEADRLRRNVGTLRRIAAMAPLVGLLGTLLASGRALNTPGQAWGPSVAAALGPFTAGVAMAILALVAYDGLVGKVERLIGDLERLGAETVDAIALAVPPESSRPAPAHPASSEHRHRTPTGPGRGPHQLRVDIPNAIARAMDQDDLYDL